MHPDRRVWVLPAVLAVFCLSVPAQLVFADRIAEPYPGLFQPAFHGVSQRNDHTVRFMAVTLSVDGQRIKPRDLIPDKDRRDILESLFPPHGRRARVDDASLRAMRRALARTVGTDPSELTVRWERRRFHLDTGQITRGKTLATYRVDLRRDAP